MEIMLHATEALHSFQVTCYTLMLDRVLAIEVDKATRNRRIERREGGHTLT